MPSPRFDAERQFRDFERSYTTMQMATNGMHRLMALFIGFMGVCFSHTVILMTDVDELTWQNTRELKAKFVRVARIKPSKIVRVRMSIRPADEGDVGRDTRNSQRAATAAPRFVIESFIHIFIHDFAFTTLDEANDVLRLHCFFNNARFLINGGVRIFRDALSFYFNTKLHVQKSNVTDNHGTLRKARHIQLPDGRKVVFWIHNKKFCVEIDDGSRTLVGTNSTEGAISLSLADDLLDMLRQNL